MIEHIPNELYLEICKYLFPLDIVRFRRVCKHWHRLINDNLHHVPKYFIDILICPVTTQKTNETCLSLFSKISKRLKSLNRIDRQTVHFQLQQINITGYEDNFSFKMPTISIKELLKCPPNWLSFVEIKLCRIDGRFVAINERLLNKDDEIVIASISDQFFDNLMHIFQKHRHLFQPTILECHYIDIEMV